ncbi:guanosine-3',5'-bis (diphosphate) 3'-pyrophosphohydrolase, putative [Actinidia rufa]|uniref:Guanosine-3',5'-bis (Diphosphate) 3'-pyrophosphohydrolase, putative n=1 Tax=Actinidia rufa TaxID=165716 RepID=A0A7J0FH69_9ERIC|nr:guanosine-3',5'-bis (diphosphate) 3'-pyrophosphohydrolase, putative [Actinidia rufa]
MGSSTSLLLLFSLTVLLSVISCASDANTFKEVHYTLQDSYHGVPGKPRLLPNKALIWRILLLRSLHHLSLVIYHLLVVPKMFFLCERVRVAGKSRLKLGSYAGTYRVTVAPAAVIPEKLHNKIQICFHRNASHGLCQCEKDEWKAVQNWIWSSVMSPYEDRYVDLKFVGEFSCSVTVTVEEEFQRWRLFCLAVGFVLLLLAPIVSGWVPFYYSSSMAIGVLLVIIILLFQLGAGSLLLHQFSMFVNSILVNFGLSEEMRNPVSVFVLLGIVLAGAALGYWIVRKFVITEDGSVDGGIAQFVKWSMRIMAAAFILQSTLDTPLAMGALASCFAISFLLTSLKWNSPDAIIIFGNSMYSGYGSPWRTGGQESARQNRAEFLSRSGKVGPRRTLWNSPRRSPAWFDSPVKGVISPSTGRLLTRTQQEHYSTFHKTPNRKKISKKEWENFTKESTREAMAGLASSPEFTDWIIKHADRIQLLPEGSSDEAIGKWVRFHR